MGSGDNGTLRGGGASFGTAFLGATPLGLREELGQRRGVAEPEEAWQS